MLFKISIWELKHNLSVEITNNILFLMGGNMKTINYKYPHVASYLLLGGIFFIIGFSKGFPFFLLGAIFIFWGIKENNKLA